MACYKHRYLVLEVDSDDPRVTASSLPGTLLDIIRKQHGDFGLSMVDCLEVVENYSAHRVLILKVNVDAYRIVRDIVINYDIGKSIRCIAASGILKKAQKRLLEMAKLQT